MLDDRGRDEIFVFGSFELNLRSGELRKRGLKLKLRRSRSPSCHCWCGTPDSSSRRTI